MALLLSEEEKQIANHIIKPYDDSFVRGKVIEWWNRTNPTNRVMENPNGFAIDLIGIDDPLFGIEVERSLTWTGFDRPQSWKVVRIPMRKIPYWLPTESKALFIKSNSDATACVLLDTHTIKNKFYNRILKTKLGYKENFCEYYRWQTKIMI